MKIALILPGSLWYAPYVHIYTRILNNLNINYSIISWNRDGDDIPEGFQYQIRANHGNGSAGLLAYMGYIRYIKKTIREQRFDRLIIFGPQMACLLSSFLVLHYKKRFIIDYRDLSIEQKPGLRQLFAFMLKQSFANVISSPGFKKCLPKRSDYLISHNFDIDVVRKSLSKDWSVCGFTTSGVIDVLTIGGIRDFSSNIEVVKALANKEGMFLRFVGKGVTATRIEAYCRDNNIVNISFSGFYQKHEEAQFIECSTFLNIFYPRIITHDTAMSNRFYNSLIYKKPMIVTKNTTQGDYAENNNIGVAIANCDDLSERLDAFIKQDFNSYCVRCNLLLRSFLRDQEQFEEVVKNFALQ